MKKLSYTLLIATLFLGLTACGDDSGTGPNTNENPPQIPDLSQAQPDLSFFENNNPQKITTNNYSQAQTLVLWNTLFLSFGQSYGTLFAQVGQEEAAFSNGSWEWSYTYSYDGVNADFRTTGQELANSVKWATYWSFNDGQGNSIDDYKIFEGTVSNDGSTGDWTFNVMNPELGEEIPFVTSTWNNIGETEKNITLEIYGDGIGSENTGKTATVYFEQNGADHSMTLDFADGEQHQLNWNTDTNTGSVTSDGEKICWDENFQDIVCS